MLLVPRLLKSILVEKTFISMNRTVKIKYVLPFFLLFTMCVFGQGDNRDKIKALKSQKIAIALKLTSTESPKFWQLYLACEEKIYDVRYNKIRPLMSKLEEKGVDSFTAKDANLYVIQLEAAEEEIFNLKKKLIIDLKPVIGSKKILKFKIAEDDFNKLMLSKFKSNKD
ncbi:hypothetical protein D3C87_126720 [compost metagenome]